MIRAVHVETLTKAVEANSVVSHMEDCLIAARLAGVSQLRYECPGYGTAT